MEKSDLEKYAEAHKHLRRAESIMEEMPFALESEFFKNLNLAQCAVNQEIKEIADDLVGTSN